MSAISDLIGKTNPTLLETAIMQLWVSDPKFQKLANQAAEQLAALEKVAKAADDYIFHGDSRKPQHAELASALSGLERLRKEE